MARSSIVWQLGFLLCLVVTMNVESLKVAVIGGGAAGLAAARVLSRNGIIPVVLEKESRVGGVWNHVEQSKDRPMYKGLRTNLPRELMAYREKPWGNGPGMSYVTHQDVLQYLHEYKTDFNLDRFIQYGAKVTQLKVLTEQYSTLGVGNIESLPLVELEWETGAGVCERDQFDAVCVANGHYAKPTVPQLDGIQHFPGRTMHSIEYDSPVEFKDQTVLCVGGRASGSDLAREITQFAKHVYLSDTTCEREDTLDNLTLVPRTESIDEEGRIRFGGGCDLNPAVDAIIFCTGYDYSFPFITQSSQLDLEFHAGERRVKPLYRQLWHARYPNLSFVGLPHSVVPFPLFELQLEAIVNQLQKNHEGLPALQQRLKAAQADADNGGAKLNGRLQDTHYLGGAQWDYCREMARFAETYSEDMEKYIANNQRIYDHSGSERKLLFPGGPDTYRSTCYFRDDDNDSFTVTATELELEAAASR